MSLAGLEPAEALFALRDADPARLVLEPWSDSSVTAGVARALSIRALDLEGAPLPNFAGPLSFELITPGATNSLALSGTFSNGTFSSVLILTQAIDGLELVVHSGALSERSPLFDVVPGPMHTLAWAAFEPVQRTTVAFPVSVQARDAFLNPITSSNTPALDLALLTGEPVFAPLSLTQYVAGVWSGEVVFTQALASAQLEARLETIHGTSDPFTVLPANDLALYLLNPPSVLGWSNLFSLTLLLTNSGPDTLSSLTLTQSLAGLELAAAEGPGWTRSLEGIALSEPLTNGALLTVQLPFIASAPGLWTNLLHASAEQPDPSPDNNQASWVLVVTNDLPVITFLAPLDQTIHPATNLVISLEATDHHGVTQLLLQADDLLLASWSEPPFSFTWTNLPPGLHQLRATAFDPAGASNSSLISIQIEQGAPSPTPPWIARVTPAPGTMFWPATNELLVEVNSSSAIVKSSIHLSVNRKDVSDGVTFEGGPTNRVLHWMGLATNSIYAVDLRVRNAAGQSNGWHWTFDTFDPASVALIELENYNYAALTCTNLDLAGGQFQTTPPLSGIDTNGLSVGGHGIGYHGALALSGVDYFVPTNQPTSTNLYRACDPLPVQELPGEYQRATYVAEGLEELGLGALSSGTWLNYTRSFLPGRYRVWLRAVDPVSGQLELVVARGPCH